MITVTVLKMEQCIQKATGMTNSVDPDQNGPLGAV